MSFAIYGCCHPYFFYSPSHNVCSETISYPEIILKTELAPVSPTQQQQTELTTTTRAKKSYSCDICGVSVRTKVALKRHVQQNHSLHRLVISILSWVGPDICFGLISGWIPDIKFIQPDNGY